jgi:hypothetical protein
MAYDERLPAAAVEDRFLSKDGRRARIAGVYRPTGNQSWPETLSRDHLRHGDSHLLKAFFRLFLLSG